MATRKPKITKSYLKRCGKTYLDLSLEDREKFDIRYGYKPYGYTPSSKKRRKNKKKVNYHSLKNGYHIYLKSKEWNNIASFIRKSRNFKCEKCKSSKNLEVHHLHYKTLFKEKPRDLLLLCRDCHSKEHNKYLDKFIDQQLDRCINAEN